MRAIRDTERQLSVGRYEEPLTLEQSCATQTTITVRFEPRAPRFRSGTSFFHTSAALKHFVWYYSPHRRSTTMPQNEYIERHTKLHGKRSAMMTPYRSCPYLLIVPHRLDHDERVRKRTAREAHKVAKDSQSFTGLRAKLYQKKRHHEKIQMKKQIRQKEESNVKSSGPQESSTPVAEYLLDRNPPSNAKALSSAIKNKRKEAAAKFSVPLPKVKGISEEEMFKVVKTGKKTAKKGW